jgi:predicted ester cyclase
MSAKENIELVLRYGKEMNANRDNPTKLLALLDKYADPKFVFHLTAGDFNLEQTKQIVTSINKSFPDADITVDDIIAEGDKVMVRYTMRATHTGEYLGVAPTGKKISQTGIDIVRIVKGKIVEEWTINDNFGLMIQLGAIPNPFVQ